MLSLCAEYAENDRESLRLSAAADRLPTGSPEARALEKRARDGVPRFHELEDLIADTKPRTAQGLRAKLEVARRSLLSDTDDPDCDMMVADAHVAFAAIEDALAAWGA